ncbi:MAG TPA: cytochrome c [Chitinophagaceae bacterium]|nr:cytochrome c [Chitinophagaceae bacterium]
MRKAVIFIVLFISYISYSAWVYTYGTDTASVMSLQEQAGKNIYQKNNCTSCHQLFGMGGFLGPELTTVISDKNRGEIYARTFLQYGGARMPNFHFSKEEIDDVIAFLKYVDANAITYKNNK